jgi:anti-sigma regulatory factor (Ser/Thr protein kinase)
MAADPCAISDQALYTGARRRILHPQMEIQVPSHFVHAGDLDPRSASWDPRGPDFPERELDIDLRACKFIQPAAALWCGVYALLAANRNCSCRLLVPENLGVAIYLKSIELFSILQKSGVDVDDRGVGTGAATRLIIPITQFTTESEVDQIANQASERLSAAGVGAVNLYSVVAEVFAELAMNAVQHSQSEIGCLGLIQFYQSESGERFVCVVADGGIGIKASLEANPDLRRRATYDWTAIEMALEEGISGTGSSRRGIGLFGVAEDMAKPGRQLIIHSGIGLLRRTGGGARSAATRTPVRFPGTLVSASIPT